MIFVLLDKINEWLSGYYLYIINLKKSQDNDWTIFMYSLVSAPLLKKKKFYFRQYLGNYFAKYFKQWTRLTKGKEIRAMSELQNAEF